LATAEHDQRADELAHGRDGEADVPEVGGREVKDWHVSSLGETLVCGWACCEDRCVRTYRDLFSIGEFRALFGAQVAAAASMTIQALAFSVVVYGRTASPLLAAVAFLAGSLPQAVGAMTLSGVSDRVAPRTVLVMSDVVRVAAFVLVASGLFPAWLMLAIVMLSGVAYGALGGIRYALLTRVLPVAAYALARSSLNMAVAAMQVAGYAAGGGLIVAVGVRSALWVAAALAIIVCGIDRWGLRARPARASVGASVAVTWRRNRAVLTDRVTGRLLLAQWVPNGLIVGAEALFVPYAGAHAAVLFTAAAAGMLVGDVTVGRWVAAQRRARLTLPLYLLLAAPYLAFAVHPALMVAAALVGVASVGYGGTLGLQQRLVETVSEDILGQVFALASAGMLSVQGVAAYLTGSLAQATGASIAIAIAGAASLVATLALLGDRGPAPAALPASPSALPESWRPAVAMTNAAADRRCS
jgi:MFS family permease